MKKSAGVIVKSGNKCLLCKRSNVETYSGEWSIPGGKVEPGEEIIDAANREFYEETNLEITDPIKYLGKIKRYKSGKIKSELNIFLFEVNEEIEPNLGHAQDGHEHTECGYFSIEEIEDLNMVGGLKDFISKIFFDF